MRGERTPGYTNGPRRAFVGLALFCTALTSPALERLAGEHAGPHASEPSAATSTARPTAPSSLRASIEPSAPAEAPTVHHSADARASASLMSAVVPDRLAPITPNVAPVDTAPTVAPTVAPLDPDWRSALSADYVVQDAGCATDLSAAGLAAFFAAPIGAIKGFDAPRTYPLGDGRTLWAVQDAFTDETGRATSFADMGYANNMVLVQDGNCFTSLRRGTPTEAVSFETGTGDISFDHYFWPAGGAVSNGVLQMFWMEMRRDHEQLGPLDGIALHPVATWLATYDVATMQRLLFVPAPDPGVAPVYGFAVVESGMWAYLFGNSFVQNLAQEGGFEQGPHSATRTYLARVPRGHLDALPSYWDGAGWTRHASRAAPISSRNWTENLMQPVEIGTQWVSATKTDGFLGTTVTVDVADEPWGPWTTVATLPAVPRGDPTDVVTYQASVLPTPGPDGGIIVSLSQIPMELGAEDAPPRYRPNFVAVELGTPPTPAVGAQRRSFDTVPAP